MGTKWLRRRDKDHESLCLSLIPFPHLLLIYNKQRRYDYKNRGRILPSTEQKSAINLSLCFFLNGTINAYLTKSYGLET